MSWTIEAVVACTLVPLLVLALTFGAVQLWRLSRRLEWDEEARLASRIGAGVCAVSAAVAVGGLWWGMYPWQAEYHSWQPISGVVATTDSRLLPAGDSSVEQKFVVQFVGDPTLYGVLDTRAAAVRPGDQLDLSCVRRWQQTGSHGYDCAFTSMQRGGAS